MSQRCAPSRSRSPKYHSRARASDLTRAHPWSVLLPLTRRREAALLYSCFEYNSRYARAREEKAVLAEAREKAYAQAREEKLAYERAREEKACAGCARRCSHGWKAGGFVSHPCVAVPAFHSE